MMRLYVTTNSPGEVATWVRPMAAAWKKMGDHRGQQWQTDVFVTPCRYASGTEAAVLHALPGVGRVFSTKETAKFAIAGRRPATLGQVDRNGSVLLFLGGEMMLAASLGRKLGIPSAVYTQGFANSTRAFRRFFVPYESARRRVLSHGAREDRVHTVGNLMVDSVQPFVSSQHVARDTLQLRSDVPTVTIFPGSRAFEWSLYIPFYMDVLQQLRVKMPSLQAVVAVSPFAGNVGQTYGLTLDPGQPVTTRLHGQVVTVVQDGSAAATQAADLVLTLPGSNTMEIAALGRAMVLALPLYRTEDIPLDGIIGALGRMPVVGKPITRLAVKQWSKRQPFASLPNDLAQRYIHPELRGEALQPREVTTVAYDLLIDDDIRGHMAQQLQHVVGGPGAAEAIAHELFSLLSSS